MRNVSPDVVGLALALGAIVLGVCIGFALHLHEAQAAPAQRALCQTLPTAVLQYGISLHAVESTLYCCYQQGGSGAGITEVRCVPMRACADK